MNSILIQLDTDCHPSVFDRVVAVDAEVEHIFSYGGVTPEQVEPLVHGAMFTRGQNDLAHTAIFIGGSDVSLGEQLLTKVRKTFFGPVRVSVMMDSNGSNTTAAAAVLSASRHVSLVGAHVLVLGGTGPVGQRAAQLLATEGAQVRVASRTAARAESACKFVSMTVPNARVEPVGSGSPADLAAACRHVEVIIAAGAAGVEMLPAELRCSISTLRVAIDLNAVPPAGIAGVEVTDKGRERDGAVCYGAVGVGGLKMKIHKAAIKELFTANDRVLDTDAIYRIGEVLAK